MHTPTWQLTHTITKTACTAAGMLVTTPELQKGDMRLNQISTILFVKAIKEV